MHVYIFKSSLFVGQTRKIVSGWPLDITQLLELVNSDNEYVLDSQWYLAEQY